MLACEISHFPWYLAAFFRANNYIPSTYDDAKGIFFCLNLLSACAYVDWIKAGICLSSYCCAAVALFMMHMIILKTRVLLQAHQSSLTENGHSSPSAIKSSPQAPLPWFIFYKNYPHLLCSYRLLPPRCLLLCFESCIWLNCN